MDNGSGAKTRDELTTLETLGLIDRLVLLPENRGTSPGYNAGFRAADPRSTYLTKLDNDVEVLTANWLRELTGLLEVNPCVGIASTEILNHIGIQEQPVLRLETGHQVRDWIGCPAGGGGMTFRRSLYDDIGGFREDYGEGLLLMPDDLEFFFRVRERRLKAYYIHTVHTRMTDHQKEEELPASHRAFKTRQYFLLRTRYFDLAQAGGKIFVPHLASVEALPPLVQPGQSLKVRCAITARDRRTMTLGCTVSSVEAKGTTNCAVTEEIETTTPRSVHELSLHVPATLPPGPYFVKATLWSDPSAVDIAQRLADLMQADAPIEVVGEKVAIEQR